MSLQQRRAIFSDPDEVTSLITGDEKPVYQVHQYQNLLRLFQVLPQAKKRLR